MLQKFFVAILASLIFGTLTPVGVFAGEPAPTASKAETPEKGETKDPAIDGERETGNVTKREELHRIGHDAPDLSPTPENNVNLLKTKQKPNKPSALDSIQNNEISANAGKAFDSMATEHWLVVVNKNESAAEIAKKLRNQDPNVRADELALIARLKTEEVQIQIAIVRMLTRENIKSVRDQAVSLLIELNITDDSVFAALHDAAFENPRIETNVSSLNILVEKTQTMDSTIREFARRYGSKTKKQSAKPHSILSYLVRNKMHNLYDVLVHDIPPETLQETFLTPHD